jgi:AcrR family transcriptional regulator
MTPKKSGRSNEEALRESKTAFLRAGAELLMDELQSEPFGALKLQKICAKTERYTSGAFYQHWSDIDSYRKELREYLLAVGDDLWQEDFDHLERVAANHPTTDPIDAVYALANEDLATLLRNPAWDATELMNLTWGRGEYRQSTADEYDSVDQQTALLYGTLLNRMGREARPPLSFREIATILQALVEGLGLRHRVDPESVPLGSDSTPGIYALGVASILVALTRNSSDSRSVGDTLKGAFADTED